MEASSTNAMNVITRPLIKVISKLMNNEDSVHRNIKSNAMTVKRVNLKLMKT